jgi:DNA repair exonuclease SbcCD ATPase subunit
MAELETDLQSIRTHAETDTKKLQDEAAALEQDKTSLEGNLRIIRAQLTRVEEKATTDSKMLRVRIMSLRSELKELHQAMRTLSNPTLPYHRIRRELLSAMERVQAGLHLETETSATPEPE